MVTHKKTLTLLAGLLVIGVSSVQAEQHPFDGLKTQADFEDFINAEQNQLPIDARYVANQIDPMSETIWYEVTKPVKRSFPGMLLPNGQIAPVKIDEYGNKNPACIDRLLNLYPGVWDEEKEQLVCNVRQMDLLDVVDGNQVSMASIDEYRNDLAGSSLSSSTSLPGNKTAKEQSIARAVQSEPTRSQKDISASSENLAATGNALGSMTQRMAGGGYSKQLQAKSEANPTNSETPKRQIASQGSSQRQSSHKVVEDNTPSYIYKPEASSGNNAASVYIHSPEKKSRYGIPIGAWVKARLSYQVNSADSSFAELELLEDLEGRLKTLPRHTKLFANKSLNMGTERLNLSISTVLTPTQEEFSISAKVYDATKREGLPGQLKRLRKEEIKAITSKSALGTLGRVVPDSTGIVDGAVSDIGSSMVNQEEAYLKSLPSATIDVSPQEVWIQIAQSF